MVFGGGGGEIGDGLEESGEEHGVISADEAKTKEDGGNQGMIFEFDGVQGVRLRSDPEPPYCGETHKLMIWAKKSVDFSYPVTLEICAQSVTYSRWYVDRNGALIVARASFNGVNCGVMRLFPVESSR